MRKTPLPRTVDGLRSALQRELPTADAMTAAAQNTSALSRWIYQREVIPPPAYSIPAGLAGKRPVHRPSSTPTLFPAGTAAPFARYAAVVDRLPSLLAALTLLDAPPTTAGDVAAPLYRASWPDGVDYHQPASHWYPGDWWYPNAVDPTDPRAAIIDVETDLPIEMPERAEYFARGAEPIRWWATVPPELADYGVTLQNCPPADLVTGGFLSLPAYAAAMLQLENRRAGYMALFASLRPVPGAPTIPDVQKIRRSIKATAHRFAALLDLFDPVADVMAGELAQYLDTADAAIAALGPLQIPGDTAMPLTSATPSNVAALSGQIRDSITAGHGGRLAVSPDAEVAFSWSPGIAATLLRYLALGTAAGRRTTVVIASDSGVTTGSVAEGGTKPNAVNFASQEVDLLKYAGIASLSVESSQFVSNIEAAVSNVLGSRILRGIEADTVAAILAAAGVTITGAADITAGVLEAIAAIRGNGGTASVVGLSAGDWIATMTATGSSGYLNFSNPEAGPAGTWLGLYPVILPTLVDGSAVVLDGSAVTVLEAAGGPLCVVDPFTGLGTNQVRIAIETWATSVVNAPGGVATVAAVGAASASSTSGKRASSAA